MLGTQRVKFFVFAIVICCYEAHSQGQIPDVDFFPGKKIFPPFVADGLEHQFSLSNVTDNRDWIGAVGGSVPVIQLAVRQTEMQVSVAATVFSRLIKSPGHLIVHTVDYRVDFPIDVRFSALVLRVALGHVSGHFADDGIERLGEKSIQYVRDYVSLAVVHDIPLMGGHVYASTGYNYNSAPVQRKQWLVQFGTEFGNFLLTDYAQLYGALDIKIKEEVSWGSIQSYQIGVKLFERNNHGLRVAYTFRRGFEERGQFFDRRETVNLISVFVDL
ncbi:MAG: DUF1207 domain-containing protein [Ignavibacteria bacterium]|nr:DUF1207 domain-containing protein [Ignavibacteria bacterium]